MPKHPAKLTKKFEPNPNLKYPFQMNDQQKNDYQKYIFAVTQYQNLVAYLNSTSEAVDPKTDEKKGYGRGPAGLEKDMDEEMLTLLQNCVAELIQTGQALFTSINEIEAPESPQKALLYDVTQTLGIATKENSVLETLEPNEPISYMAMHARATDVIIDTGTDKLDRAKGGKQSSRMIIRYMDEKGKLQSGFFTEDGETGITFRMQYEKLTELCPNMSDIFTELEDKVEYGPRHDDEEYMKLLAETQDDYRIGSMRSIDDLTLYLLDKGVAQETITAAGLTDANAQIFQEVLSAATVKKIKNKAKTQELLDHQDFGYSTNSRNTAMSDMATALGMKGLLAKSTPMTLIRNGEAVHGTFMANAEGFSIDDIKPDTSIMEGKDLLVDYDSVVKDGTDMMVLDYICLNRDRHESNHFYKVTKNEAGDPVLTGLQGIDNDSSFGAYVPQKDEKVSYLPPLTGIKMMKKQTADMVLGMTEARIKGVLLGKGLSENEISACWERTKKLQAYIQEKDKVKIITDKATINEFSSLTGYALAHKNEFSTPLYNVRVLLSEYEHNLKKFKENNPPSAVKKAVLKKQKEERKKRIEKGLMNLKSKVYVDYRMTIKCQSKKIKSLYSKLKSPKDTDSNEYKEMYAAVKELNDNLKLFQKKEAKLNGRTLTANAKLNILSEQFKEVQSLIRTYVISLPKEPSPADKKRISTVSALKQVCDDASTSREREVHQLNTLMKNAHQQIGEVYELIKPADPEKPGIPNKEIPPFERTIAEHVLQAKIHLASFVGNCEQPQKKDMPEIHKDMATLVIVNKINNLKENNLSVYQDLEKEITRDSSKLDDYIQKILNNSDFNKIMKQTNPINALVNNTTAEVTKLAEDMNVFRDINLDTSKDPLASVNTFW